MTLRRKRDGVRLQRHSVFVPYSDADIRRGSAERQRHSGEEAGGVVECQNVCASVAGLERHDRFMLAERSGLTVDGEAADVSAGEELRPTRLSDLIVRP